MNAVSGSYVRVESGAAHESAYDAYLAARADASPFHRRAWGEAVAAACGHKAHSLVAYRGGCPVGVLPLVELRSRLFGKAMISNGFAVEGGPLFDDGTVLAALDEAAWALTRRAGIDVIEYRGTRRLHPDWAVKDETYARFVRPLAANSEAGLAAIPRKQRAEVRKSLNNDLTVSVGRGEAALDTHYRVYAASVRNLGTPVFPKALFREVLERFGADADILSVSKDGRPIAAVLSVYHEQTVYPYWGGGTVAARGLKANEHMYWMLMEHGRERGMTRFDFGRSKVGTGAYAYKKNWGFEPEPLVYEYRLAAGAAMPDLNPNSPKYRSMTEIWRRLPLPLANALGPMVARNLG